MFTLECGVDSINKTESGVRSWYSFAPELGFKTEIKIEVGVVPRVEEKHPFMRFRRGWRWRVEVSGVRVVCARKGGGTYKKGSGAYRKRGGAYKKGCGTYRGGKGAMCGCGVSC